MGLARRAAELRRTGAATGAYPETLAEPVEDRWTGRPWRYERHDDGSATLSAPGAGELWLWKLPPVPS